MQSIVYHQHAVLHIIKPQKCTLARDDILALTRYTRKADDIQTKGLMIYQVCGLDKKILVPKNKDFLYKGYKKIFSAEAYGI